MQRPGRPPNGLGASLTPPPHGPGQPCSLEQLPRFIAVKPQMQIDRPCKHASGVDRHPSVPQFGQPSQDLGAPRGSFLDEHPCLALACHETRVSKPSDLVCGWECCQKELRVHATLHRLVFTTSRKAMLTDSSIAGDDTPQRSPEATAPLQWQPHQQHTNLATGNRKPQARCHTLRAGGAAENHKMLRSLCKPSICLAGCGWARR